MINLIEVICTKVNRQNVLTVPHHQHRYSTTALCVSANSHVRQHRERNLEKYPSLRAVRLFKRFSYRWHSHTWVLTSPNKNDLPLISSSTTASSNNAVLSRLPETHSRNRSVTYALHRLKHRLWMTGTTQSIHEKLINTRMFQPHSGLPPSCFYYLKIKAGQLETPNIIRLRDSKEQTSRSKAGIYQAASQQSVPEIVSKARKNEKKCSSWKH